MTAASIDLLVGVAWASGVTFMFLELAGISTPISNLAVAKSLALWFAGPLCLVAASVSILLGKLPRASLIISAMAAVVLTGIVGNTIWDVLHPQPLEAPPAYGFNCVLVGATVLCDLCIVVLAADYRRSNRTIGVIPSGAEE
jgi:FtsH-binding integral membrane protein